MKVIAQPEIDIPLGKSIDQPKTFSPEILAAVPRSKGRICKEIEPKNFSGLDRWTAYELLWFEPTGVAHAGMLNIEIDCHSKNLVESKSLKLFLNSCYYRTFQSSADVESVLTDQISNIVEGGLKVQLLSPKQARNRLSIKSAPGQSIDKIDTNGKSNLEVEPNQRVHESLYTDMFRSLCPVTEQPDWATILIEYCGSKLDQRALLGYLMNYAEHSGFHEACVESIFQDIKSLEGVEEVSVCAKFLRRGGIDICPFRTSTTDFFEPEGRLIRQ
tara:strand:- start:59014 stop:59832 length:819 start_codon:yes stop_codon:yes gene_type:complete